MHVCTYVRTYTERAIRAYRTSFREKPCALLFFFFSFRLGRRVIYRFNEIVRSPGLNIPLWKENKEEGPEGERIREPPSSGNRIALFRATEGLLEFILFQNRSLGSPRTPTMSFDVLLCESSLKLSALHRQSFYLLSIGLSSFLFFYFFFFDVNDRKLFHIEQQIYSIKSEYWSIIFCHLSSIFVLKKVLVFCRKKPFLNSNLIWN